jgi:hypothetical protein
METIDSFQRRKLQSHLVSKEIKDQKWAEFVGLLVDTVDSRAKNYAKASRLSNDMTKECRNASNAC